MEFELSKSSRLYRWAYLLTNTWNKPKRQADLCKVFWRVVFLTPLKLTFYGACVAVLLYALLIGPVLKWGWVGLLVIPAMLTGVFATAAFISFLDSGYSDDEPSFLTEAYRGFKAKYCPIVKVVP